MEECEEESSRFVCKLCNKKFTCGKSLGGHMRSHVVFGKKGSSKMDEYGNGSSSNGQQSQSAPGYGLRENPKKTWRACLDSKVEKEERVCKQCGKAFHSLKALCGHMASHSDKDRGGLIDDHHHSWTRVTPKMMLLVDSHSDTEENRKMGFGSLHCRSKKVVEDESPINNESSSVVSEIDGQENVEIAMCLMMLSRDYGVNSVVDSSDNNSVVLETKSSSIETRVIGSKESLSEMKKGCSDLEDSDSAYFLDECAKAEDSDGTIDGHSKCKKPLGKLSAKRKRKCNDLEIPEIMNGSGNKTRKPSKKRSNVVYESRHESGEDAVDGSTDVVEAFLVHKSEKKMKHSKNEGHVCPFCNKAFKNGQALGGHKRSHLVAGRDGNKKTDQSPIVNKPKMRVLLDLNLPAPEGDDNDDGGELAGSFPSK